jgi:glycosyltransferase involved in cell wall biosynthesis
MEAMSCGVPCVVSNVGDINDLVKNNVNGFVINNYSNVKEFAEKIYLLLENQDIYDKFSKEGMKFMRKKCTPQTAKKIWIKLLEWNLRRKNV